jgi:hypothetical protein
MWGLCQAGDPRGFGFFTNILCMGIHLSNVHVGYNQGSINAIAHFKYPTSVNIICRWPLFFLHLLLCGRLGLGYWVSSVNQDQTLPELKKLSSCGKLKAGLD